MSLPAVILPQPASPVPIPLDPPERRMTCPRCHTETLTEVDRDGVAIDRCDRCHGVWLDRGELERLLARAAPPAGDDELDEPTGELPRVGWADDDWILRGADEDDDDHLTHPRGRRRRPGVDRFD